MSGLPIFPAIPCFNSRTREGATSYITRVRNFISVSIHAPVKVRRHSARIEEEIAVSIHAPVKVRHDNFQTERGRVMFQFTHP